MKKSPQTLADVSHLYFTSLEDEKSEKSQTAVASPEKASPDQTQRKNSGSEAKFPQSRTAEFQLREKENLHADSAELKRYLSRHAGGLYGGTRVVDTQANDVCGADMVLTDIKGRTIFLDIEEQDPRLIPFRVYGHLHWLEQNEKLFLRAYARNGLKIIKDPVFLFVTRDFSSEVVKALKKIKEARVKLYQVKYIQINGTPKKILLEKM